MAQRNTEQINQLENKAFEPRTISEKAFAKPGFAEFFAKFPDAEEFRSETELTAIQEAELEERLKIFEAIQEHVPALKDLVKEQIARLYPNIPIDNAALNRVEAYYTSEAVNGNGATILEMAKKMKAFREIPAKIAEKNMELEQILRSTGGEQNLRHEIVTQQEKIAEHGEAILEIQKRTDYEGRYRSNQSAAAEAQTELVSLHAELERERAWKETISYSHHARELSKNVQILLAAYVEINGAQNTVAIDAMEKKCEEFGQQLEPLINTRSASEFQQKLGSLNIDMPGIRAQIAQLSQEQQSLAQTLISQTESMPNRPRGEALANRLKNLTITYEANNYDSLVELDNKIQPMEQALSSLKQIEKNPLSKDLTEEFKRNIQELNIRLGRTLLESQADMLAENAHQAPDIQGFKPIKRGVMLKIWEKFSGTPLEKHEHARDGARIRIDKIKETIANIHAAEDKKARVKAELDDVGQAILEETDLIRQVMGAAKKKAQEKRTQELGGGLKTSINAFAEVDRLSTVSEEVPYLNLDDEFTVQVETDTGTETLTMRELRERRSEILLHKFEAEIINKIKAVTEKNFTSKTMLNKLESLRLSLGTHATGPEFLQLEIRALNKAIMNPGLPIDKSMALKAARDMLLRRDDAVRRYHESNLGLRPQYGSI